MPDRKNLKETEDHILNVDATLEEIEREYFRLVNTEDKTNNFDLHQRITDSLENNYFAYEHDELIKAAALIMRLLIKEP